MSSRASICRLNSPNFAGRRSEPTNWNLEVVVYVSLFRFSDEPILTHKLSFEK